MFNIQPLYFWHPELLKGVSDSILQQNIKAIRVQIAKIIDGTSMLGSILEECLSVVIRVALTSD